MSISCEIRFRGYALQFDFISFERELQNSDSMSFMSFDREHTLGLYLAVIALSHSIANCSQAVCDSMSCDLELYFRVIPGSMSFVSFGFEPCLGLCPVLTSVIRTRIIEWADAFQA